MSSPGVGPELWLHSPSHRVGKELIDFPLGTQRAQSTLNPQVDTLAQRDGVEEQNGRAADTWPEKARGVGEAGVGWRRRRKLGSEDSQLPSRPRNPAEPHSAAVLVQSRGDINGGRGYCQAKGRQGASAPP